MRQFYALDNFIFNYLLKFEPAARVIMISFINMIIMAMRRLLSLFFRIHLEQQGYEKLMFKRHRTLVRFNSVHIGNVERTFQDRAFNLGCFLQSEQSCITFTLIRR